VLPVWLTDTVTSDLDRALHYTLLWGLEGVVLRTVGGPGDRVPHVNEARLKRRLREHEMPAVAVDPGLFEQPADRRGAWMNDLVLLDETVAFCERIGCRRVIVGGLPEGSAEGRAVEAFRRAGDRAARRGCIVAVRNETGGRATGRALAELLEAVGHPAIRACWSPADALEAGESAEEGVHALGAQVEMVLVRDGSLERGVWQPRPLGEGAVGWPRVWAELAALSFDGPACLDLSALDTAKEGLHEATALIRMLRAAQSGAR
jgi:sugar phosphate isomerase/epimerase